MRRVVEPEILDELPADDPEARASRVDLRRINFLMGNERWLVRRVGRMRSLAARGIVEWGAGSGALLEKLSPFGPVTGVDRVARPEKLPGAGGWRQADVFDDDASGGVLVANLFLHHFEGGALRRLGGRMEGFAAVVAVEPWRSRTALALGGMLNPFVSRVTRHDMPVSIRAGFRRGELSGALGLDPDRWQVSESVDPRGGVRWSAVRRDDPGGAAAGR
jgi:hypothetical protein